MKNYKNLERHYLEGNFYINEFTKNDYSKSYGLWKFEDGEKKFISLIIEKEFNKMVNNQVNERDYRTIKSLKEKKNRARCEEYFELMEREGLEDLELDTCEFNEDDLINHNLTLINMLKERLDSNLEHIEGLESCEKINNEDIEDIEENMEENKNIVLQYLDLNKDIKLSIDYLKEFKFEEDTKEKHIEKFGYYC